MFLNNRKTPLIPLLHYDNRFITDFKEKAELFNSFFYKQWPLISNNSSLRNYISYTTEKRLSTVALSVEAIGEVKNLDSNKARGHDNVSIRMLKICCDSSINHFRRFLDELFLLVCFSLNGIKETLFLFTRKMTRKISSSFSASDLR